MEKHSRLYSYRPVDSEHRGFRLAILQPSSDFPAPISCDLVEVTLHNKPLYEALSYVWGDPANEAYLRVEGAILKVTASLELALRYLRLADRPRTIWVDAICIDQSNIEERNKQVRLMKDIYSSCTVDLVWLGEADEWTQQGIDSLRRMKSLNLQRLTDRGRKHFGVKGSDDLVSFDKLGLDDMDSYVLSKIIRYPTLWERVWVMQEISCCPEATLVVGNLTMQWSILSSVLDHSGTPDQYHHAFSHQRYDKSIWDAFAKVQVIEHQREALNLSIPLNSTLLDVLSRFRATYSTDPRDKIYGLLGLATDNLDIIPDYNKSPQDVYIDVVRAQINATQDLDIITQSLWPLGHTPSTSSNAAYIYSQQPSYLVENLPSWLPNFSCTIATKILFAQRSIFNAGATQCSFPIRISSDGVFRASGAVLGAVSTIKSVRKGVYSGGNYFSPWARDWMPDSLAETTSEPQTYATGGDSFEAYWRTLMTDCLAFPTRRLDGDDLKKYKVIYDEWRTKIATLSPSDPEGLDKYDGDQELLLSMGRVAGTSGIADLIQNWQFAELEGALYAMVPWGRDREPGRTAKAGDVVVAVDGGKVPLVFRKKPITSEVKAGGNEMWEVIGTAYVHGFMDGLAADWVEKGLLKRLDFDLI